MGLIATSSLMRLGGMYLMIAFAWWLLQIIANWRIFTKAGESGWKSIIPIYGDYISPESVKFILFCNQLSKQNWLSIALIAVFFQFPH